jgi:phosphatidate cytidylyltransferase
MTNQAQRIISSLILAPLFILLIYLGDFYFIFLLSVIFFLAGYEIVKINSLYFKFLIFIVFSIFLLSFYEIRYLENGFNFILFIISITWLSDIGGYFFGKFFKGKKISVISPNKTYAGFAGSLVLSQASIIIMLNSKISFYNFFFYNLFFIAFCSLIVILGDLFFSFCKRKCNIKDYSNIIPGHGGIFDRFDGMIFLVIFFNFYIKIL